MDREEIREQFSPILDDELTSDERAAIESELAQDAELLRELHTLKRVDELYRRMPPAQAPAGFEADVRNRLRPKVLRIPASVFTRRRFAGLAAAAAALVLVAGIVLLQYRPQAGRFDMAAKSAPEPSVMAEESLQLGAPVRASATAPVNAAADAAAPASSSTPLADAPMQSDSKETMYFHDDFSYPRGGGSASSRRGETNESSPSSREHAEGVSNGRITRGVPQSALGDRFTGVSETGAAGSGDRGGAPRRDEAERLEKEERNSLYQAGLEAPKQESETPSVELQNRPQDAPASQPQMIAGLPVATERLGGQLPSTSAPPAISTEPVPPLVPAESPEGLNWDLKRPETKMESATASLDETGAAPVAAPAPAPPQIAAQDRTEEADHLQKVVVSGQIRARGTESTAPEVKQESTKNDKDDNAAMHTSSPAAAAADVQMPGTKRIAGQRVFDLRDGVWRQSGYKNEAVVLLNRDSDVAEQLVEKEPGLKDVYAFDKPVIFRAQDRWYRLEPAKK